MKKENDVDLELFDILEYLDDRGVDYATAGHKNVSVGWIGLSCPFCRDKSTHLGVNLESKMFSCFRCGKKGGAISLVQEIDNSSYSRAKGVVSTFITRDFSHLMRKERTHASVTMLPRNTSNNFLPIHDKFLASRKYDRSFLERKYDIMAVGPTCDDWKFRVVIPVYLNHELVTYVARDTTGKLEVPYKNCPIELCIQQAKHTLYGIDEVKDEVILVEGILDAWRIGTKAVATFGTQVTDEQIQILGAKSIRKAYVLFDADATSKAESLAYAISSVVPYVEVIQLSDGDPDNLTEDEVFELKRDLFIK